MNNFYLTHLTSSIYYLIKLFYKTDCQYSSGHKKINILLTIYTLCNLKDKNNLNLIVKNDILNVMIPENMLCREIYRRALYKDNNQKIEKNYNEKTSIPNYYQNHINKIILTKEQEELLENIFLSFGAYELETLSKLLNEIQTTIPFKNNLNLDINEFILFLNANSIKFRDNEIFNFIRTYYFNLHEKGISMQSDIAVNQQKSKEEPLEFLVSHMLGFTNQRYELAKQFEKLINTSSKDELKTILGKIEEISKLEQKTLKKIKKTIVKRNENI